MKRESRAPLIVAIVLLHLPVLYVGSYFALVVPGGWSRQDPDLPFTAYTRPCYRWGGKAADIIFWPLEQIDRKVRPRAWLPII